MEKIAEKTERSDFIAELKNKLICNEAEAKRILDLILMISKRWKKSIKTLIQDYLNLKI